MAVRQWIKQLSSADENNRYKAAECLVELAKDDPTEAEPAIPALIAVIHDDNDDVRREAMWALGYLGPLAADAGDELIKRLAQEEALDCYCAAAIALARIGRVEEALPELIKIVDNPSWDPTFGYFVLDQLAEIGEQAAPAIPSLKRQFGESLKANEYFPDGNGSDPLATALRGVMGAAAMPLFVSALAHENVSIRWEAAFALGDYGTLQPEEFAEILHVLQAEEPADREKRSMALFEMLKLHHAIEDVDTGKFPRETGPVGSFGKSGDPNQLPLLLAGLNSTDTNARSGAAHRIRFIGADASEAIDLLLLQLEGEGQVRESAMWALAAIGEAALNALITRLDAPSSDLRRWSAITVKCMGEEANAAVPKLLEVLEDCDPDSGEYQIFLAALASTAGKHDSKAFRYLAEVMVKDESQQRFIAGLLEKAGTVAKSTLPELRQLLKSESEYVRKAAEKAIAKIAGR